MAVPQRALLRALDRCRAVRRLRVLPAGGPGVTSLGLPDLAMALAAGTLTAVLSTLAFAVAESQLPSADPT